MAFENFTNSGHKTPNNPNNNNSNNNNNNQNAGQFQNPYFGGGQPTGEDVKEKLINYNEKFKSANPILYRDEVILQTLTATNRKTKPNPILIGLAGVGKTQLVEELARLIETKSDLVPKSLKNKIIYELPLVNVTAGTMFRGQMEENIKEIIEFFSNKKNNAILFIDEIHTILQYDEISQAIKPALARGDIKLIAATTMNEYNKLMKDPALNRRLTPIIVDELNVSQTTEILKNIYPSYEQYYDNQIRIPEDLFEQIVYSADRNHIQGSHKPDNAITLMDNTMSALMIDRLRRLNEAKKENNQTIISALTSNPIEIVTSTFLNKTAEKLRTGNSQVDDYPDALIDALSHIKGQDHIIDDVINIVKRSRLNLNPFNSNKPLSFMFVGPSGVGKTEISKLIAKYVTGLEPILLNMQEYNTNASVNRIIGSPLGYVGSDSNQELPFDTLRSNPRRVIVLDEFEKGDKSVQRLFMSAIDEGYIKDNRGNTIDFSQAIIIATTNAGQTNEKTTQIGFSSNNVSHETKIDTDILKNYFDIELLNRFKNKLQFNSLSINDYEEILIDQYNIAYNEVSIKYPQYIFEPTLDEDTIKEMVKSNYTSETGARRIKDWIQTHIENQALSQI